MTFKERYWQYSLIAIILFSGIIIFLYTIPFLSGILGAFTIYILIRRQMFYLLLKRKMKKSIAALLLLLEVILFFLIPLSFIVLLFVNKLENISLDPNMIIAPVEKFATLIDKKTGYDLLSNENMHNLINIAPQLGQTLLGSITSFGMNLLVLMFVLYFMLTGCIPMEKYMRDILPFNNYDTQHVLHEVNLIVRSNAIGIPLLAIIQGGLGLAAYYFFDVPAPFLMFILTCIATILPVVGTALIWVPLGIYLIVTGHAGNGIGLIAYGFIVIAQSDNVIRFLLQKKMADTHPLVTIFGVIIGLSIFGFMGIIFGPLLLSLFLLFVNMFKKEYLDRRE